MTETKVAVSRDGDGGDDGGDGDHGDDDERDDGHARGDARDGDGAGGDGGDAHDDVADHDDDRHRRAGLGQTDRALWPAPPVRRMRCPTNPSRRQLSQQLRTYAFDAP